MPNAHSQLWHWRVCGGRRKLQVYFYSHTVVWQLTDREKLKQKVADLAVERVRSHPENQVTLGIGTGSTAERFIQGLEAIRHRFHVRLDDEVWWEVTSEREHDPSPQ